MAILRADGLYDIPEAGLSGVPANMVPPNVQQSAQVPQVTVPPVQQAPMATGIVAPGINDQQQAQQGPVNFKGVEPVNAQGQPLAAVAPTNLHGPESAANAPEPGAQPSQIDIATNANYQQALRGTPGVRIPGGDKLVAQQWEAAEAAPRPGAVQMTDPETGEPVWQTNPETGAPLHDRQGNKIPVMTSNATMFKAEQSKESEARGELGEHEQAAMLRQAGGERALRDTMGEGAQREAQYVQNLEKQLADQEAMRREHDAQVQRILEDIQRNSAKYVEPNMHASFTTSLGQGLLFAGAAVAGQQVPHINFIGDEINRNIEAQRIQAQQAMQLGVTKINALQQLQQHFTDPVAAEHALAAANWSAVAHHAEAMTHGFQGGAIGDRARALAQEANVKAAEQAKMAYGAEKKAVWQTVPDRVAGGVPGGRQGLIQYLNKLYKDAPKETRDNAINKAMEQYDKGIPFTAPGVPGGKLDRAKVAKFEFETKTKIRLPDEFGGGIAYAQSGEEGAHARKSLEAYGAVKKLIGEVREVTKGATGKIDPTDRGLIERKLAAVGNIARQAAEGGVWKASEAELIDKEIGADAFKNIVNFQDLDRVANDVIHNLKAVGAQSIKPSQLTRTPGGDDYVMPESERQRTPE